VITRSTKLEKREARTITNGPLEWVKIAKNWLFKKYHKKIQLPDFFVRPRVSRH
jgi:hypothetical protein